MTPQGPLKHLGLLLPAPHRDRDRLLPAEEEHGGIEMLHWTSVRESLNLIILVFCCIQCFLWKAAGNRNMRFIKKHMFFERTAYLETKKHPFFERSEHLETKTHVLTCFLIECQTEGGPGIYGIIEFKALVQ